MAAQAASRKSCFLQSALPVSAHGKLTPIKHSGSRGKRIVTEIIVQFADPRPNDTAGVECYSETR
jgi:hypothetical protein